MTALTDRDQLSLSLPARGVWIEMRRQNGTGGGRIWSLPARGVWIEISRRSSMRPARGVWIEIFVFVIADAVGVVTPREGSVD